jgi:hypothetical protein
MMSHDPLSSRAEARAAGVEVKGSHASVYRVESMNGEPALVSYYQGKVFAATFYRVMNPEKLTRIPAIS